MRDQNWRIEKMLDDILPKPNKFSQILNRKFQEAREQKKNSMATSSEPQEPKPMTFLHYDEQGNPYLSTSAMEQGIKDDPELNRRFKEMYENSQKMRDKEQMKAEPISAESTIGMANRIGSLTEQPLTQIEKSAPQEDQNSSSQEI
jgi:hypothetical protein